MFLALMACSAGSIVLDKSETPSPDDTATTTDSGAVDTGGGDTGGGGTTIPDETPICGHLSGIAANGTRWSWDPLHEQPGVDITRVATVVSMQDGLARVSDEIQYNYDSENYQGTYTYNYEYVYNCDADGVWLLGQTTTYSTEFNGHESVTETQLELDDPALIYPLEAALGDTWVTAYAGHQITDGHDSPYQMKYDMSVIAEQDAETPYGTVPTLRVMSEYAGNPYQTWYVGVDIGLVQDQTWTLRDYAP